MFQEEFRLVACAISNLKQSPYNNVWVCFSFLVSVKIGLISMNFNTKKCVWFFIYRLKKSQYIFAEFLQYYEIYKEMKRQYDLLNIVSKQWYMSSSSNVMQHLFSTATLNWIYDTWPDLLDLYLHLTALSSRFPDYRYYHRLQIVNNLNNFRKYVNKCNS